MAVNSLACPRLISLPVQRREKRTDAAPHLPPHRKRESVDIDSAQSVFGTAMDLLRHYESLVDRGILKDRHNNPETRKSTFRKTVECIQQIVTLKLYRAKCNSLETYFASEWKISRAQVYRFLDCAVILEDLADFEEVPCKERLCRALRKLTKSKEDLRRLWSAVLQRFPAAERDSSF
ncbi:hypothetical protein BKA69DRAFT_593658 [Paraphysoderma sedebokerense]|nr:hypothetical protein BKA69DRAFT_593658 [Paraphysoderma sedebokerense]